MEKKAYTFLIFPGPHGKLYKISLPFYVFHSLLILSIVGVITLGVLASSYARMLLKVSHYNAVRKDREALKNQYRSLQAVVQKTNEKLDSLQSLAAEVALTYGFADLRRSGFPHLVVPLAAASHPGFGGSYDASHYTFNLLRAPTLHNPNRTLVPEFLRSVDGLAQTTTPSLWPVRGSVTAGFGQRLDPFNGEGEFHSGMDISAAYGSAVSAPADGLVVYAGPDSAYGNVVVLNHGYGVASKYAHLSRIAVVVGMEVKRGQSIGAVGTSGRTTGAHLHYEILVNEVPVNPARYLKG